MDINVLEDKENALLERREVRFEVRFSGPTPGRKEVKEALRSKLGVDSDLVVIHKLTQPFGITRVEGDAAVYKNEKAKAVEHEHLLLRDSGEKGGPKDTGKAAPAEKAEKKEEKKVPKAEKAEKAAEGAKKKEPAKAEKEKGEKK